jgi:hypothetical protein
MYCHEAIEQPARRGAIIRKFVQADEAASASSEFVFDGQLPPHIVPHDD